MRLRSPLLVALLPVLALLFASPAGPAQAQNAGGGGGGNSPAHTETAGGYRIISSAGTDGHQEECTLGFNVVRGGRSYFLTAGHCALNDHYRWYRSDDTYLGWTSKISDTDHWDYALISYTSSVSITKYGSVYIGNGHFADITTVAYPEDLHAGQPVCFTGATSGHHCGKITNRCYYGNPRSCVIEADICTQGGDSGGPLYQGSAGVGILIGSTDKDHPCDSLFSPLLTVLEQAGDVGVY